MWQWYFLRRMKSQADWDRRYGRWTYMIIWCTGGSKFSMSYFPISQLPTTQLHHHYYFPTEYASSSLMLILTAPLCFSIFKVGLFKPGLDALLGNPHTPSSLDTDKALEPTIHIFFMSMALLLQLLRWQQRCWEKALKIGYYRHLGTAGDARSRC